jgi:hypothetical protein
VKDVAAAAKPWENTAWMKTSYEIFLARKSEWATKMEGTSSPRFLQKENVLDGFSG